MNKTTQLPRNARTPRTLSRALFALGVAAIFAGCGGDSKAPDAPAANAKPAAAAARTTSAPAAQPTAAAIAATRADADGVIRVEVSDLVRFSTNRIEVTSGQKVRIELVHTGRQPKMVMGHNLVVLKPDTDVQAFGVAAALARDTGFIPPAQESSILARTDLIGGGETSVVEFIAPAPGTYTYVCSFPGHFAAMRGQLIVREADGAEAPSA